jgi:HlyD family secretion protein
LNSALRWHPQNDLIAPEFRQIGKRAEGGEEGRHGRSGGGGKPAAAFQMGTLYEEAGKYVRPIQVKLGLTDGTLTEVQGEGLAEGTILVTGVESQDAGGDQSASEANPFVPQFGKRNTNGASSFRRGPGGF